MLNVVVTMVLTVAFKALRVRDGVDRTAAGDHEAVRMPALDVAPVGARRPATVEGATTG